jgi:uncharacterized protein
LRALSRTLWRRSSDRMEIRDPVHGSIHILEEEIPIISHPLFCRLRNIKQLGLSECVFPGATHTRYLHSIGVMYIGERAFDRLFKRHTTNGEVDRLRESFKLACLLHDIGHAPLSHSSESVMPPLKKLEIDRRYLPKRDRTGDLDRQATHEDYTVKFLIDDHYHDAFKAVEERWGVKRSAVAALITGNLECTSNSDYFAIEGIDYFPLLHQLVSSELDCDRMDYLMRDSYFCGVSYGHFDLDWLLDNLTVCIVDGKALLGISERAVVTFDDFLLSRFHMFLQVYFHYRSVCLEQLLLKFFKTSQGEYQIPADLHQYMKHDDHYLMSVLRSSSNPYAQAVVNNQIPPKVCESFNQGQLAQLNKVRQYLEEEGVEYIHSSSQGRLSRYYHDSQNYHPSILVVRSITGVKEAEYTDIFKATDLFEKFSQAHAVNRLHFDMESLNFSVRKKIMQIISVRPVDGQGE